MRNLKTKTYEPVLTYEGYPDIFRVDFKRGELCISLDFEDGREPIDVCFASCRGYRVLDEGDLLEFWDPQARSEGWIWQVLSGGWMDLEATRKGFISGTGGYDEYLIMGMNECVSVISNNPPTIS